MIETLQKINKIVPNLTVSQLIELVNIINGHGFKRYITINTSNNKTTSTENPFSVSNYL